MTNLENATGLYKAELEGRLKGEDVFDHHAFLRSPTGTKEAPCVVESTMEYRVVGAPDPDDDSIIHWGRLEEGAPAMKIGNTSGSFTSALAVVTTTRSMFRVGRRDAREGRRPTGGRSSCSTHENGWME